MHGGAFAWRLKTVCTHLVQKYAVKEKFIRDLDNDFSADMASKFLLGMKRKVENQDLTIVGPLDGCVQLCLFQWGFDGPPHGHHRGLIHTNLDWPLRTLRRSECS
jgi:hypothetical protein